MTLGPKAPGAWQASLSGTNGESAGGKATVGGFQTFLTLVHSKKYIFHDDLNTHICIPCTQLTQKSPDSPFVREMHSDIFYAVPLHYYYHCHRYCCSQFW